MSKVIGWNRTQGASTRGYAEGVGWYEITRNNVRGALYFSVEQGGRHLGDRGSLGLAKELADDDAVRRMWEKKSNPSTRYRKTVKVSRKRNPEGWHEYLTGGVKNWSKTLSSGAKIVITEPWKGGWSMYQVNYHPPGKSYGTAHFANADTLSEAFDAGRRAVKHYEAQKRNPLSPYAKMQRKAGFKAPPKPKFKIGYYVEDNYGDGDLHTRPGRVTFVGSYTEPYTAYEKGGVSYEGHSGGYKYKVQEPDGRTLWRDEQRLRRIKAPRSRKNPPSSGLAGTYAITRTNPFWNRPKPKFVVGDAVAFNKQVYGVKSSPVVGVVLDKQRSDGSWHYLVAWPKGYMAGDTWVNQGDLRHARRNPDLSGPLTITHDGPDLHITHKANPSRAPFGWAKVEGGVVAKISRSSRKPGKGWGAINTSGTRVGDRAYLDGGDVYLR